MTVAPGMVSVAQVTPANVATAPENTSVNSSDALKAIDQLTEQNRQLEKQNQLLMEQIAILRRALAAQQSQTPQAAEPAAGPPAPGSIAAVATTNLATESGYTRP